MDQNGKDDLKTQFATREGTYRLMTLSEYSRPNRVGYQSNQNNPQVRVSLITLPPASSIAPATSTVSTTSTGSSQHLTQTTSSTSSSVPIVNGQDSILVQHQQQQPQPQSGASDRICFNFGKELYVYAYRGVKKVTIINSILDTITFSTILPAYDY